jgi:hypothetical protein
MKIRFWQKPGLTQNVRMELVESTILEISTVMYVRNCKDLLLLYTAAREWLYNTVD